MQAAPDRLASTLCASPGQRLLVSQAANFVFGTSTGAVVALGGIDSATLRQLVDEADTAHGRRALFIRLQPVGNAEFYVEQVISAMAEAATRLWPFWFNDISFAMCRDDALGRQAAGVIAREAAARNPGVSALWTEAAAVLALGCKPVRVAGVLPAIELAQLSRAISNAGIVVVADVSGVADASSAGALPHALEWIARHSPSAVVALFDSLPTLESPFDGILYGARCVIAETDSVSLLSEPERGTENWLAPWRGAPHPMSEIEQRLAAMLRADAELADLFRFNWTVDTVRGSRPKVDLVWTDGRLVVELDGYRDHTTRGAFIGDRQRDYELVLSGYSVLRLANDEVKQDFGRAIEKIRDLVRLRRSQLNKEGRRGE